MRARLPALAALLLLVAALGACGGGGDGESTGTTQPADGQAQAPATAPIPGGPAGAAPAGGKGRTGGGVDEPRSTQERTDSGDAKAKPAPLEISGGGSAEFRVKGGDNSVPDYGVEADSSELAQAAETLHAYVVARLEGDWVRACSYLSTETAAGLEQLVASSSQSGRRGCPAALATVTTGVPLSVSRRLTVIDAASLRVDGAQAFLLFQGAGGAPYSMPMTREGGSWALGAILPSALS